MKKLLACYLMLLSSVLLKAQEGSFLIQVFSNNTKDTSSYVVDVRNEAAVLHFQDKSSHLPIDFYLNEHLKNLVIVANEGSQTAMSLSSDEYLNALKALFDGLYSNIKLEKIDKPNSEYNYRYKSKDLLLEASLDTAQLYCLHYLQLLKLNPLFWGLELPSDHPFIKALKVTEKNVETTYLITFNEHKQENAFFQIPETAKKISLYQSKLSKEAYLDFIKNLNKNF